MNHNLETALKIGLAVLPLFATLIGYLTRNWINGLVGNLTSMISKLSADMETVKENQNTQQVAMKEMQMDIKATKQMVEQTQKHVDNHGERLRVLEIEHSAIAQWKRDKEDKDKNG